MLYPYNIKGIFKKWSFKLFYSPESITGPPGPFALLAGGLGFEPRLTESESAVLPLDDPPEGWAILNSYMMRVNLIPSK